MLRASVVDDEPSVSAALECFLQIEGYAVRTAADGAGALTTVRVERSDFIVLDLRMPDMDGLEVLRQVHGIDPTIVIILLSAYLDRAIGQQALALGARACLQKPINLRDLRACLARELSRPDAGEGPAGRPAPAAPH
jgi:DNA-binding response OmpR family regulator